MKGRARLATLFAAGVLSSGCAAVRMTIEPPGPRPCRTTIPADAPAVRWIAPVDADDRKQLAAWCEAVGPVVEVDAAPPPSPQEPLVLVSWNMAVGEGSLIDLVNDVRSVHAAGPHLVILIQEAYRALDVPARCPAGSGAAGRLGSSRPSGTADILELARQLRMYAAYAPSMRNGMNCEEEPREDRGNAILSTLPLSDIVAIELPFAQQRRVAVAATVRDGSQMLHVVSVHFDTFRGHGRQARALSQASDALGWQREIVIGGDFNARPLDPGIREMRKHFTEVDCGGGATHAASRLRLDRLFTRGLTGSLLCQTGRDGFGSDHRPVIAQLVKW